MAILVVYWSGSGNTEIMAQNIYDGIIEAGFEADLKYIDDILPSEVSRYDKIAFGCPSMDLEKLEPYEFLPWYEEAEHLINYKLVALFGSYGWGDGEWMDYWEERALGMGFNLFENGFKVMSMPSEEESALLKEFGMRFAKS